MKAPSPSSGAAAGSRDASPGKAGAVAAAVPEGGGPSDLHPELVRHLREAGIGRASDPPGPEAWQALLRRLSGVYTELDQAHATVAGGVRRWATAPAGSDERSAAYPVLDRSVIDSIRGLGNAGTPDPVIELCTMFLNDIAARLVLLRRAVEARDATEIVAQAHAVKGAAGNFGARRMYAVAKLLQDRADSEEAGAIVSVLDLELEAVDAVVKADILDR